MPRIQTGDLASHRDWRREQLISAATQIALEKSTAKVSIAAVAARAGLSRTSVYEYFASRQDLIADLLIEELRSFSTVLQEAVNNETDPIRAVQTWITASLNYVADGRHLLAKALHASTLPKERSQDIARAHRQMLAPLNKYLQELGISDTARALSLLQAATDVATKRIESRVVEADVEISTTVGFCLAGLKSLSPQ